PRAIAILRAIAAEERSSASTPPIIIPSQELVGDVLLEAHQPREAAVAFRAALAARPNRSHALLGLAKALAASGDEIEAEDTYRKLRDNWQRADALVLQSIDGKGMKR